MRLKLTELHALAQSNSAKRHMHSIALTLNGPEVAGAYAVSIAGSEPVVVVLADGSTAS